LLYGSLNGITLPAALDHSKLAFIPSKGVFCLGDAKYVVPVLSACKEKVLLGHARGRQLSYRQRTCQWDLPFSTAATQRSDLGCNSMDLPVAKLDVACWC
jgi:hypothetical protein